VSDYKLRKHNKWNKRPTREGQAGQDREEDITGQDTWQNRGNGRGHDKAQDKTEDMTGQWTWQAALDRTRQTTGQYSMHRAGLDRTQTGYINNRPWYRKDRG